MNPAEGHSQERPPEHDYRHHDYNDWDFPSQYFTRMIPEDALPEGVFNNHNIAPT